MPFVNCRRDSQNCSRSRQPSLSEVLDEEQELGRTRAETQENGIQYANVKVMFNNCTEKTNSVIQEEPKSANPYVNLEFSNSLKLYENSRDLLQNTVSSKTSNLKTNLTVLESKKNKCCEKCSCKITVPESNSRNDDYLLMEPAVKCSLQSFQRKSSLPIQQSTLHEKFSQGYLPMIPVSSRLTNTKNSDPKISSKKSQSTPTLPIENQKTFERLKQKNGMIYHSISANSSPSRYHIRNSAATIDLDILTCGRKRSISMDSAKFLASLESNKDEVVLSPVLSSANSTDSLINMSSNPKQVVTSSSEHGLSRIEHKFENKSRFEITNNDVISQQCNGRPFKTDAVTHSAGKIKRSASIPCKYVYNRDSSSSNDSGVSSGSLKFRKRDAEFDFLNFSKTRSFFKLQKCHKTKREHCNQRKSKSFDVLEENTLVQVNKSKSSSAEAIVQNSSSKGKNYTLVPETIKINLIWCFPP